jgi:hypothetical protein
LRGKLPPPLPDNAEKKGGKAHRRFKKTFFIQGGIKVFLNWREK